ncbi:MAG TPA: hypothetical protein VGR66_10880 [Candidatus Eisenbacteria bacterium]|nr:hypothetical protein [Candidatus Eisenbacteria bacterium]
MEGTRSFRRVAALVLAVLVLGCTSNRRTTTERTEFENSSARRLEAARQGLDSLAQELRIRSDTARVDLRQELDSLSVARDVAARKLDTLKTAESQRWQEIKGEMSGLLSAIETRTDSLRARMHR